MIKLRKVLTLAVLERFCGCSRGSNWGRKELAGDLPLYVCGSFAQHSLQGSNSLRRDFVPLACVTRGEDPSVPHTACPTLSALATHGDRSRSQAKSSGYFSAIPSSLFHSSHSPCCSQPERFHLNDCTWHIDSLSKATATTWTERAPYTLLRMLQL